MPIYFEKQWWSGDDREKNPGTVLDPQPDWPKPLYRPGWDVAYRTSKGKRHTGRIRYVLRDGPGRLDFYRVIRHKNDAPEITFACEILERLEKE
jgi:hypothetical protein